MYASTKHLSRLQTYPSASTKRGLILTNALTRRPPGAVAHNFLPAATSEHFEWRFFFRKRIKETFKNLFGTRRAKVIPHGPTDRLNRKNVDVRPHGSRYSSLGMPYRNIKYTLMFRRYYGIVVHNEPRARRFGGGISRSGRLGKCRVMCLKHYLNVERYGFRCLARSKIQVK